MDLETYRKASEIVNDLRCLREQIQFFKRYNLTDVYIWNSFEKINLNEDKKAIVKGWIDETISKLETDISNLERELKEL